MLSYEVANVEEAVEYAYELKNKGEYDWFRGQVLEEWAPVSSLHRAQVGGNEEKALRRVALFYEWLEQIPELKYLREEEHVDDFCAIMQHYGIPTHYIDFTTDPGVAGFFAGDTKSPVTGQACIFCLNTEDLMASWGSLRELEDRKGAQMELVKIDVENLWRLQAQQGVFLFSTYNWNIDYPMFRITFPYSGYPSYPTREMIYPADKSPLEQLLDQYFELERATFFNEEMGEFFAKLKAQGRNVSTVSWEVFPKGFYEPAFVDESKIVPLDCWADELLVAWDKTTTENYQEAIGPTVRLQLKPNATFEEVKHSVSFGVRQFLRAQPGIRPKSVNWVVTECPATLPANELIDIFRPVWNGMRRLPYDASDIGEAFGSIAALMMQGFRFDATSEEQQKAFTDCFGDALNVGFANQDKSGSFGMASVESLKKALRPDFENLLTDEHKERARDVTELFRVIYNPRLMFDFGLFKDLFARQIIPTQAILKRNLILFNPTRLITFGLP